MKNEILKHLKEAFGLENEDGVELFISYVETVNENLDRIKQTLPSKHFEDLSRAAHSIKGCALNCGHSEMAAVSKEAEFAGKAQNIDEFKTALAKMEKIALELNSER